MNPIVVRDSLGCLTLALFSPIYFFVVLALYFLAPREFDEYLMIAFALGGVGLVIVLVFAATFPVHGLQKARIEDELLSLTPMTAAEQVHGYLTAPLVLATASIGYFASFPFLPDSKIYGDDISNVYLLMLYSFLFFLAFPTYLFSFFARMTKTIDLYVGAFGFFLGVFFLALPSLGVLNLPNMPNFNLTRSAGFLYYWAFIPGIMATVASAGYLLSLYHFSRPHEPFWRAIIVNWVVCLILGGFYAIIIFVAHLLRVLSPFGS